MPTVHIHLSTPESINLGLAMCLDRTEQSRSQTFQFIDDRKLYVTAHIFLRQVLSHHAPLPPAAWTFATHAHGKPYISNTGYQHLHFSLSHTRGRLACAVSTHAPLGIDVERVRPLDQIENLCRQVLTPLEYYDLLKKPHAHREPTFFRYWTLKEAYIKALGMGLSLPLQSFFLTPEQKLPDGWQTWRLHYLAHDPAHGSTEAAIPASSWQCSALALDSGHALALAIPTQAGEKITHTLHPLPECGRQ